MSEEIHNLLKIENDKTTFFTNKELKMIDDYINELESYKYNLDRDYLRLEKENEELKKYSEPKIFVKMTDDDFIKEFANMGIEINKLKYQQKEFIEYMNKTIEELECDDVGDEELKGYLIQEIDIFKEILLKYKEIIEK